MSTPEQFNQCGAKSRLSLLGLLGIVITHSAMGEVRAELPVREARCLLS